MGGVLSCMSGNRHRDLSPGCGPCSGLAWLQPFQFAVWKPLKNNSTDNHSWIREPLQKSRFLVEKFEHSVESKKKKMNWMHWGR